MHFNESLRCFNDKYQQACNFALFFMDVFHSSSSKLNLKISGCEIIPPTLVKPKRRRKPVNRRREVKKVVKIAAKKNAVSLANNVESGSIPPSSSPNVE